MTAESSGDKGTMTKEDASLSSSVDRKWRNNSLSTCGNDIGDAMTNDTSSSDFCPDSWDSVLCWPQTGINETASLPCFEHFQGIPYNSSGIVTRTCNLNGNWSKSDYSNCQSLGPSYQHTHNASASHSGNMALDITTAIYLTGYCFSLCTLLGAAAILFTFKELRCLRNRIHSHLIATYILADALWVITVCWGSTTPKTDNLACVTFILLHYFHLTNFFWMLVEGMYLYVLVIRTFMAETIKFRTYCFIGWGTPFLVVLAWTVTKWATTFEIPGDTTVVSSSTHPIPDFELTNVCPWLHVTVYDWIYKAAALLVLLANVLFLTQIMWVLITKLRSVPQTGNGSRVVRTIRNPMDGAHHHHLQGRKAVKAFVVLMPLLGITYILVLIGPTRTPLYEHFRAFLLSIQGFLVALLYCFCNAEVRHQTRIRWSRFRHLRLMRDRQRCPFLCCACHCGTDDNEGVRRSSMMQPIMIRDWSPSPRRSRTDSIPMTRHPFRKRDSSTSETTTVTTALLSATNVGLNPTLVVTQPQRIQSVVMYDPTSNKEFVSKNADTIL